MNFAGVGEMTGNLVRIYYLTNNGRRLARRKLRKDERGEYVMIGGLRCNVEAVRYNDTSNVIHYVSVSFDYKR